MVRAKAPDESIAIDADLEQRHQRAARELDLYDTTLAMHYVSNGNFTHGTR